jgi:hypothetical protein
VSQHICQKAITGRTHPSSQKVRPNSIEMVVMMKMMGEKNTHMQASKFSWSGFLVVIFCKFFRIIHIINGNGFTVII